MVVISAGDRYGLHVTAGVETIQYMPRVRRQLLVLAGRAWSCPEGLVEATVRVLTTVAAFLCDTVVGQTSEGAQDFVGMDMRYYVRHGKTWEVVEQEGRGHELAMATRLMTKSTDLLAAQPISGRVWKPRFQQIRMDERSEEERAADMIQWWTRIVDCMVIPRFVTSEGVWEKQGK